MEQNIKILKDKQFDIDGFFNHIDNLNEETFDICEMYKKMIVSLIDNIQYENEFKFELPLSDQKIHIFLENKKNILKVIDYIIKHLYTFEIYECIKDFMEIKKYYEE